ncbi:MAG: hypothetical protein HYS33_10510 [Acidobacteria bacterium]|nr:hypothetical protein [Acidobacteriota bacterium]MBI1982882.1 hypothetical protein [Acidobacteriota bacterium]
MTPQEMERTMQFIVQQQAQFTADMHQVGERLREEERVLTAQNQAIVGMVGMMGELREVQASHEKRLTALETAMKELAAAGKETEERLNAFIVFVEKYISSRNDGNQNPSS